MVGVDLMDSHIGRFRIQKSKKWYFRLFYHMVDLAIINAWLLHREQYPKMNQKNFRIELGQTMCNIGKANTPKRGRPSAAEQTEGKKIKNSAAKRPPIDVRMDEVGHWPTYSDRQRCKLPGSRSFCDQNVN